ncbi:hypothetical protein Bbelb_283350 [Branchiostoma belcheri]|nr:hypothetical protein Bbelb_283350 [Branchiostoma belcheri]
MSGHVTNPSYFISFVKPAPAKADSRRNTVETSNASTTQTTRGNQPVDASLPAVGYSPVTERSFPPRAKRLAAPGGTGVASRHPEDSDSSLGTQFRVVGTGHPAGSPCTERRDAVALMARFLGEKSLSDNQRFCIGLVVEQPEAYFGERLWDNSF